MQLPQNTPSPTPVVEGGRPSRSQVGPPLDVTPERDHSPATLLSPVVLRADERQHRTIFSMISPLTNAPARADRDIDAMYMDGRDAPSVPAAVNGYNSPAPTVYPVGDLEVNTSRLIPPAPSTLRELMPRLGMTAEYMVQLVGPVVGIQTRWLLPHTLSSPDNVSTFSSWSLAARHYRIHHAGNTVRVVQRAQTPVQPPRPATPPAGCSRNPIEVNSASPKKKRNVTKVTPASPKKKPDAIAVPSKKKGASRLISSRTRINKSLKRPSPIPSTPSASPPRQRRRHHSPQQSGFPSAMHDMPSNDIATGPAANSKPIEISSDSDSSNSEIPAVVRGRRGAPSVIAAFPTVDALSESEEELPAPAFMFRILAGASPDDMYDSDSLSEGTPLIAATLARTPQRSPFVPATSGPIARIQAGASPDDMYDSDSPSEATPSISMTLTAAVQNSSGSVDTAEEGEEGRIDTLVDFDRTPLSTQGMPAATPPNRATHRHLTPAGFPLTQSITNRRFLTPTLRTPLRYTTPGTNHSAVDSPDYSPFAHLSQAELDSLLEDQLDSLR